MTTRRLLSATLVIGALFLTAATPTLAGLFVEGRFQTICNTIDTNARGSDTSNDLQIWSYATIDAIPSASNTDGDIVLWSANTYKLLEAAACHVFKIRDTLGKRQTGDRTILDYVKGTSRDVGAQSAQLDQINRNVLRLIDQSSNGTTCVGADARRSATAPVSSSTISQCTSRCIATLNQNGDELAADNVNTERAFAQCIVRCSSNTGNNYECARRYLDLLGGSTPRQLEAADPQNGHVMAEATQTFINRCLLTPTYLDCHRGCDTSGSVARNNVCVSRCTGMNAFGSAAQALGLNNNVDDALRTSLLEGGFTGGSGDASMIIEPTDLKNGSAPFAPALPDTFAPDTLSGSGGSSVCLSRCDSDRINCTKAAANQKDLDGCTNATTVCRSSCALMK